MSTGIAYLQIDDGILSGRLRFRRPFLPDEAAELKYSIPQEFGKLSPANIAGILRLGSVEPAADYIVVFPNSHQHNLECITAYRSLSSLATTPDRLIHRIVCFFMMNPEEKIVSTSDVVVLPSQILDYETACRVREAMMKECAMIKKDLNRDFYHYYNFFVNTDYGYCNPARSGRKRHKSNTATILHTVSIPKQRFLKQQCTSENEHGTGRRRQCWCLSKEILAIVGRQQSSFHFRVYITSTHSIFMPGVRKCTCLPENHLMAQATNCSHSLFSAAHT
eukprot:ANDGO_04706.mRNA.1 hypothetical protein